MLSHFFVPKFIQRKKDKNLKRKGGAVINLSSMECDNPSPDIELYCATKKFNQIFSTEMNQAFNNDVDILCAKPYFVDTDIINSVPGSPRTGFFLK